MRHDRDAEKRVCFRQDWWTWKRRRHSGQVVHLERHEHQQVLRLGVAYEYQSRNEERAENEARRREAEERRKNRPPKPPRQKGGGFVTGLIVGSIMFD